MNEDGSFTFGYVAEDGSFREETRGVDCITRGKYGYIDPDGKRREFTYVSGLPCDEGAEEGDGFENSNDIVREDPIAPSDRFRTSQVNRVLHGMVVPYTCALLEIYHIRNTNRLLKMCFPLTCRPSNCLLTRFPLKLAPGLAQGPLFAHRTKPVTLLPPL